ncbi:MAG: MoxR family ATPase [Polyangiaceae bacterium]
MTIAHFSEILREAKEQVARVIVGQNHVIDQALIAILTRQHALIEGVPGLGKTLIVRTLAKVLGCEFGRIQFTPDMMPSDITGMNVFDLGSGKFNLVKGPVFTEFLLADEINRAPAKTQAGLLQAMAERTVTIDRRTYELSENFTVFATQNPIEHEGTYPLPEAQKDRFMLKIDIDFPEREEELTLANLSLGQSPPETLVESGAIQPLLTEERLTSLRASLETVVVRPELVGYVVDVVRKSRTLETVLVPAGPRAVQSLVLASRAIAAIRGRDFVTPDDVKEMAVPVLSHRIALRPEFDCSRDSRSRTSSRRSSTTLRFPNDRPIEQIARMGGARAATGFDPRLPGRGLLFFGSVARGHGGGRGGARRGFVSRSIVASRNRAREPSSRNRRATHGVADPSAYESRNVERTFAPAVLRV